MKKLLKILTPEEIRQTWLLTVLMIFNAAIETTGIVSIAPFLAVLGNRNAVENNVYIQKLYVFLGFHDPSHLLMFLGISAFAFLLLSSLFRALVLYAKNHYIQMRRHALSVRMLKRYLRQPYEYFVTNNSSNITKTILNEVEATITGVLAPLLDMISYGFITSAILLMLFIINPAVALAITSGFGLLYTAFYFTSRKKNYILGLRRKEVRAVQFRVLSEIFGGVKELKLLGRERAYLNLYEPASLVFSKTQIKNQASSDMPRYIVEAAGFCVVFGILLYMLSAGKDLSQILPTVGVYVFAGYRLLPALQAIYSASTKLRFGKAALDEVYQDIVTLEMLPEYKDKTRLPFETGLALQDVFYKYPNVETPALQDVSLSVPKGSSLGIVGTTGAGKSTLIDLILGLILPSSGELKIDGNTLTAEETRRWQNNIGYVPQHIFLADDTIARNIAFGIPAEAVDMAAVRRAATMAQLDTFIETELPGKYETTVGERGVRLSGGQRQRIGIARALYHNPDIVVFDEATSALDIQTEAEVIKSIDGFSGMKTIIMVTHRLATVAGCDQVVTLSHGRIVNVERKEALRA